jgi:PDZ domain
MTRSSQGPADGFRLGLALSITYIAAFALAVAAQPLYAQHGAAGGHFAGGGHYASSSRGAARHFARGLRSERAATRGRTRNYLTYIRGTAVHHAIVHGSSPMFFAGNPPFVGRFSPFPRRFGFFRRGSLAWGYGLWPWWGWDDNWDDWTPDCDSYESKCGSGQGMAEGYPEAREDSDYREETEEAARPMIMVYLQNGSGYGALDYWLTNGTLYIETTYGAEKAFSMDQVDVHRTFAENAARGVTFTLAPSPLASDPGPMFAPDSYAPDCPSPSSASQPTGRLPSTAAAYKGSWFGASGSSSDRGLTVDSVRSDSPAALIGVRPGDIVLRVNCQQVRSAQDIESAVNSTTGPIWVSYMIRGAWLTDKKISR